MSEASKIPDGAKIDKTDHVSFTVEVPGKISVVKTYKEKGFVTDEESEENLIKVQPFAHNGLASVTVDQRMTVNMGDFNSAQVGISVTLPCYVEQVSEAYLTAKNFVETRLTVEVKALRDYKESVRRRAEKGGA